MSRFGRRVFRLEGAPAPAGWGIVGNAGGFECTDCAPPLPPPPTKPAPPTPRRDLHGDALAPAPRETPDAAQRRSP